MHVSLFPLSDELVSTNEETHKRKHRKFFLNLNSKWDLDSKQNKFSVWLRFCCCLPCHLLVIHFCHWVDSLILIVWHTKELCFSLLVWWFCPSRNDLFSSSEFFSFLIVFFEIISINFFLLTTDSIILFSHIHLQFATIIFQFQQSLLFLFETFSC